LNQTTEKRTDHPKIAYLIGFFVLMITVLVFIGVLHYLAVSPHGPEALKSVVERYFTEHKSAVLEEAKRLQEMEIHRHFHNTVEFPKLAENKRPACYICHSDYPHVKNKKIRSLLNMHTQFFVCETCHIKKSDETTVVYKWYNPNDKDPSEPFFGTRYDPDTGRLATGSDLLSKIAPFFEKGDQLVSAIQEQDAPLARDFVEVRDSLTPEQRDVFKMKFHGNIKPKGYECEVCHSKTGVLDFNALGFTADRTVDLQEMNIKGMITKYEVFHLPALFK
jgi:hypothetical protein